MANELNAPQRKLADFMSNISERCWHAGWMENLEYALWDAVINGERVYGHNTVTQGDINALKELSTAANCWIIFDDNTEETAVPLEVWSKKFQQDIQQNPKLLKG